MNDLYIKDSDGKYVPITLEAASSKDLADKLIVITVGSDAEPASIETLEYVQKRFIQSKVIIEAMRRSKDANLLILPHIIKLELISRRELDSKVVCIRLETNDDVNNLPEIKEQLKKIVRKDIVLLPSPISLEEYREVKAVKNRIEIRKQRNGGGASR